MRRMGIGTVLVAAAILTSFSNGEAQTPGSVDPTKQESLQRWIDHLQSQAGDGSVWWTSNTDYLQDDGIDAYLMRFETLPGNVASRGCLWGERDGQVVGPFWEFFSAWDVEHGRPLLYQVSPGGMSGIGHLEWDARGRQIAEQTFRTPDGTLSRIRHETVVPDPDTHESKSLDWVDGRWAARRSYTWVRREGSAPC